MKNTKKVAILVTDGFEQSEFEKPKAELEKNGIETTVISLKSGSIKGWSNNDWSKSVDVDLTIEEADADDYDLLLLPGGVINPDKLRLNKKAIAFTKTFSENNKPIAAICHGPWLLINAEAVSGKKVTSWPSLKIDLENAGGVWVDQAVAVDDNIITSRNPDDIPAFTKAVLEALSD